MVTIETSRRGAELISIKDENGNELLHDGKTSWGRHAPILFPRVGGLEDDITIIGGQGFTLPKHGFARDMEFEEIGPNSYKLVANEETKREFPFDFELYISYKVDGDTVSTCCTVKNVGSELMPFGLGFHPAFKCDYSSGESRKNHFVIKL